MLEDVVRSGEHLLVVPGREPWVKTPGNLSAKNVVERFLQGKWRCFPCAFREGEKAYPAGPLRLAVQNRHKRRGVAVFKSKMRKGSWNGCVAAVAGSSNGLCGSG